MKFGFRRPSLRKRIAARMSWKRFVRHSLGVKAPRGWGWLTNPRKASYNLAYNRTSFDLFKTFGRIFSGTKRRKVSASPSTQSSPLSAVFGVIFTIVIVGFMGSALKDKPAPPTKRPTNSTPIATPLVARPISFTPSASLPATRPAISTLAASPLVPRPSATSMPAGRFASVDEAQREAMRRYPGLGIAGSKLNTAFVARYKLYQQQRPDFFRDTSWPIRLAEEFAELSKFE